MNPRLLKIIGMFVAAVAIIVGFILFVNYRNNQISQSSNPTSTPTTQAPTPIPSPSPVTQSTGPLITKISDTPVVAPSFSYDQLALWYFTQDGHLFKQNTDSGIKQEFVLPNNYAVSGVIWPNVGFDFIIVSKTATGKSFVYYNSTAKSFVNYPANVRGVDFLPDGKHIIYEWDDAKGKATLSMANTDLSAHKPLLDLPESGMIVKVSPLGNKVLLYKAGSPTAGKLYYATLDTYKIFTIKTASDNQAIWAPDGQRFIFNKLGPDNDATSHSLWLGDIIGGADTNINVSTLFTKVAFDNKGSYIYAAVPNAGNSSDSFWKIDAKTLNKTMLALPASASSAAGGTSAIHATNLLGRNDGRFVFFTGSDGYLYSLAP